MSSYAEIPPCVAQLGRAEDFVHVYVAIPGVFSKKAMPKSFKTH